MELLTPFEDTIFHLGVFETEDMLYLTGINMFSWFRNRTIFILKSSLMNILYLTYLFITKLVTCAFSFCVAPTTLQKCHMTLMKSCETCNYGCKQDLARRPLPTGQSTNKMLPFYLLLCFHYFRSINFTLLILLHWVERELKCAFDLIFLLLRFMILYLLYINLYTFKGDRFPKSICIWQFQKIVINQKSFKI